MKKPELTTKHLQIQKTSSQIFVAIVIASVIVSFSIVLLNILWSQSQFNIKVQDQKEVARDQLQINVSNIEKLSQSYVALELGEDLIPNQGKKTNSTIILDALPSVYDYPAVASSVQNLANKSGVRLKSFDGVDLEIDAVQSEAIPQPVEIPVAISVSGTYKQVSRMIVNFEHSIRPFAIKNMRMTGSDSELIVDIEIITYYQPGVDLDVTTRTVQ